jgi:hypothetical protein
MAKERFRSEGEYMRERMVQKRRCTFGRHDCCLGEEQRERKSKIGPGKEEKKGGRQMIVGTGIY